MPVNTLKIDPSTHLGRRISYTRSRIQHYKRLQGPLAAPDQRRLRELYGVLYRLKVIYTEFDGRDPLQECKNKEFRLKGEEW